MRGDYSAGEGRRERRGGTPCIQAAAAARNPCPKPIPPRESADVIRSGLVTAQRRASPSPEASSKACLALEDGAFFEGRSFGRHGETEGEVVFNTALSGYQEVLTDPSYAGQIVAMTYPHIGNYGVNREDVESTRPQVAGFVVREVSTVASSWRASGALHQYLDDSGIVGISEVDTRALTRHLRTHG
ncbi:MAG: hypothetical protein HY568_00900, partial [Candidatus Latescibacteria bacterium]|nr:hypothetical protein [Candidatus Latescibacterota bacterium]